MYTKVRHILFVLFIMKFMSLLYYNENQYANDDTAAAAAAAAAAANDKRLSGPGG